MFIPAIYLVIVHVVFETIIKGKLSENIKGRITSKLLSFFVTYIPELAADPNRKEM